MFRAPFMQISNRKKQKNWYQLPSPWKKLFDIGESIDPLIGTGPPADSIVSRVINVKKIWPGKTEW